MLSKLLHQNPMPPSSKDPDETPVPPDPFKTSWSEVMASVEEHGQDTYKLSSPPKHENPGRAWLNDLPEELLIEIFECFTIHVIEGRDIIKTFRRGYVENIARLNLRNLRNLCYTSRRLYRIGQSILYKRCIARMDMYSYVRTIITNPQLAAHVKSLFWNTITQSKPGPAKNEVTQELQKYDHHFAIESALTIEREWQWGLGETLDAYITTILMYAQNIEHICVLDNKIMGLNIAERRKWLEPIRLGVPHQFQQLKSADITMTSLLLDDAQSLMMLPSLRKLRISQSIDMGTGSWSLGLKVSNVERLEIHRCFIETGNMTKMVGSCRSLRSFCYVHNPRRQQSTDFVITDIQYALDTHASSLEDLKLWGNKDFTHDSSGYHDIGSFENFGKLASLSAPLSYIMPNDPAHLLEILPPKLKTLHLGELLDDERGADSIRPLLELASGLGERFATLETIYLGEEVSVLMKYPEWEIMKSVFLKEGITLKVYEKRHEESDKWIDLPILFGPMAVASA